MVKFEQVRKCFSFPTQFLFAMVCDDTLPEVGGNLTCDQTSGFYM